MKEFTYIIQDPVGIHARPAGLLVKAVKELDSNVTIAKVEASPLPATATPPFWPGL